MTILDTIIARKKEEILLAKTTKELSHLQDSKYYYRKTFSLRETLKNKTGIIAEFKRQSPSKGIINNQVQVADVVSQYEKYGASAVSILTDTPFFGGRLEDIHQVRPCINIPILRKDFMIDEYQFYEAKAIGADLILLIAACLSPSQVADFTALAHELGLEVLLEIHSEEELKHINPNIDFVGINNRNLKDFKVDLQHSVHLKDLLPKGIFSIAESGIYHIEDYLFLKEKGFDGFLMGEYFMRHSDPGKAFEAFTLKI